MNWNELGGWGIHTPKEVLALMDRGDLKTAEIEKLRVEVDAAKWQATEWGAKNERLRAENECLAGLNKNFSIENNHWVQERNARFAENEKLRVELGEINLVLEQQDLVLERFRTRVEELEAALREVIQKCQWADQRVGLTRLEKTAVKKARDVLGPPDGSG